MKKVIRKIKLATFTFVLLAVMGYFPNNGMFHLGCPSNTVYAATTLTSDDGLWTFTTDGAIKSYLGSGTEVTIPAQLTSGGVTYNITTIPWDALSWNHTITSISIGSNITSIDNSPFKDMTSLQSITVSTDNANYCDINGILYNQAKTKLMRLPQMNSAETLELPSTFVECNIDGIETCPNVHILKIPVNYTGISSTTGDALEHSDFPNLTSIEVLQGNTTYSSEDGVLYNSDKTSLCWYPPERSATDFTIPDSVTTIVTAAFQNADNLQNLNLTANIQTIESLQFSGCQLTSINNISTRAAYINWDSSIKSVFQNNLDLFEDQPFAISLVEQEVQYAIDTYIQDGMSDYQKIKALYDYAANKVSYDYDHMSASKNHCISSIFLGDSTVCEGYALGMSLLLDKAGITNCPVSGSNHAWDAVQISGIWLEIDATWDDSGTFAGTTYFLKTAAEYVTSGHPAYSALCNNNFTRYSFGVDKSAYANNLPECTAIIGDINQDGVLDDTDIYRMRDEIHGYAEHSQDGYYNVLADMNRDGAINTDDYNLLYDIVY